MTDLMTLKHTYVSKFNTEQNNNMAQIKNNYSNVMNPENLIYTCIHTHTFNTEHNNVANIITESIK
jgi:hypothetical protein